MIAEKQITDSMQMQDIMEAYPGAKRALFQKYHIGGCQSCGFSPTDTLSEVFIKHNRPTEVEGAITYIYESARVDEEMQIEPAVLKAELDQGIPWKLIDVRDEMEAEIVTLPGSQLITRELAYEILEKMPKDVKIAFYCHSGIRSMEATSYFKGHGLKNVKSLKGGIDRWAVEIDQSLPRY
ncbi:MAG: rhodanese-like domain-containing protein [Spirochaetia bacterium]|nr:rhodanese-like domain-containing protein [Spirochaetia bacterium]